MGTPLGIDGHGHDTQFESVCVDTIAFSGPFRNTCYEGGCGVRSACSPNSPIVRTTKSTFSRYAFTTSRARRTVNVLNVLHHPQYAVFI